MSTPYPPPRSSEMVVINLQGRNLSLPKTVVKRGVDGWNSQASLVFCVGKFGTFVKCDKL